MLELERANELILRFEKMMDASNKDFFENVPEKFEGLVEHIRKIQKEFESEKKCKNKKA